MTWGKNEQGQLLSVQFTTVSEFRLGFLAKRKSNVDEISYKMTGRKRDTRFKILVGKSTSIFG